MAKMKITSLLHLSIKTAVHARKTVQKQDSIIEILAITTFCFCWFSFVFSLFLYIYYHKNRVLSINFG